MDYGEVLSKAWQIIWKHKVLWIFGILAGCSSVGSNSSSIGRGNVEYRFGEEDIPPGLQGFFFELQRFFENISPLVWVLLAIFFLILTIVFIFLTTIGRIGLIRGVSRVDDGTARLDFTSLFNDSTPYFWRVFLLNLVIGLGIFLLVLVLLIPLIIFSVATLGVGLLCLIPFVCLLVPLGWLVNLVTIHSDIAIVTENRGILEGLRRGWEVVIRNLGPIIVVAVILAVAGFIAGLIIGLPLVLVAAPALIGLAVGDQALQRGLLTSLVVFVLYLPILLVLNGIVQSYITSTWTLTFKRLTGRRPAVEVVEVVPQPSV